MPPDFSRGASPSGSDRPAGLSQYERRRIQEVLELADRLRRNTSGQSVSENHYDSPDTYVARTPYGGIQGITESLGTGSGTWDDSIEVHSAECRIYKRLPGTAPALLVPTIATEQRVYNLSRAAIPGNTPVLTHRDKFGTWWVDEGGVAGGGGEGLLQTGTGTGTGTAAGCSPILLPQEKVECENGVLNVYTRNVSVDLLADGCLAIDSLGDWTYDRSEGNCGVTAISVTNIVNFINYTENVIYFNYYDGRIYINIGGIWYGYCTCWETTGTGTSPAPTVGTGTGTGTGTGGGAGGSISVGCCPSVSLPTTLTATVQDAGGCSCAVTSFLLSWIGGAGNSWRGSTTVNCGGLKDFVIQLSCPSGSTSCNNFSLTGSCGAFSWAGGGAPNSCSCSPFSVVWNSISLGATGCCAGNIKVIITP